MSHHNHYHEQGRSHDDHGHSHEGHDHSNDITPALQSNLYRQIDFDKVTTLNETESGSGKAVVQKPWTNRLDDQPDLTSDADEQLLIHIP